MARTESNMLALGTPAPDFALPDLDGNTVSLIDFAGKPALLVMFICNHCPYVQHVQEELGRLSRDYEARGVGIVAIQSNDTDSYPDDRPEHLRRQADECGFAFPYLLDTDQSVAKAFRAACTPDFYVFDRDRKLVYRGQLDDSRPRSDIPVTGKDLRAALDAVLAGRTPDPEQRPSLGCNIKWRPGNEPSEFTA